MRRIALVVVILLAAGCTSDRTDDVVEIRGGEMRLLIVPPHPGAGTLPDHVLVNDSAESVSYGYSLVIEHWAGEEWRPLRGPRCAFPAIALQLEPGERSAPEPVVPCRDEDDGLPRGLYRVTKDFDVWLGGDEYDPQVLTATFVVR